MHVEVWNYLRDYAAEKEEILTAVDHVFSSGQLILGESVASFESEFAGFCGAGYGIGLDNGTNGLLLALKALGVGAGDEVITVPNTAVPTVSAIVAAGATPRFVDVDPRTLLMDPAKIQEAISPRTRCLVPVHLYGQCADMRAIGAIARQYRLRVVEDCSHAHGAQQHGRRAGTFGDIGVFSLFPTKPLGALGDGCIAVTDDASLEKKLRRLRYYGMETRYFAEEDGYNSRLDEVQAEILRCRLRRLAQNNARRRAIAVQYAKLLTPFVVVPGVLEGNDHVYHQFVVRHKDRDQFRRLLSERGVMTGVHYPWPVHTMPAYARWGYRTGAFPVAERACAEVVSLPMFPSLTEQEIEYVCSVISEVAQTDSTPEQD